MAVTAHYDYHLFSGNERINVSVINTLISSIDNQLYEIESFSTEEHERATQAENKAFADLDAEIKRATSAEKANASSITAETTRAKGIEQGLRDDVNALLDGTKASGKATADAKGNVIDSYYAPLATVTQNLNTEKTRATKAENDLQAKLTTVTDAVSKLNSGESTEGSVAYQIAQIVNDNHNGKIDTLKELADWIVNDKSGAAKMSSDISTLQTTVAKKANDADISTVGKSGKYADLKGLPSIPSKVSDLTNDSKFVTETELNTAKTNITKSIPTKVSSLTNDKEYVTKTELDTAKEEINNARKGILTIKVGDVTYTFDGSEDMTIDLTPSTEEENTES